MTEKIRVDIWSDIACPWCYLGKRRFDAGAALFAEQHPDVALEVESHSYELAPDTPEGFAGGEVDFLVTHKGMPRADVESMLAQMTELAASERLAYDFGRVQHVNTRRAHRLLHLAKDRGVQAEMSERLFAAYFTEGANLADPDVLAGLAADAGLDPDEARAALSDETYGEAVDRDITRARMLGVAGVPFFLFDGQYSIPGAQSAEIFADALGRVLGLRAQTKTD